MGLSRNSLLQILISNSTIATEAEPQKADKIVLQVSCSVYVAAQCQPFRDHFKTDMLLNEQRARCRLCSDYTLAAFILL